MSIGAHRIKFLKCRHVCQQQPFSHLAASKAWVGQFPTAPPSIPLGSGGSIVWVCWTSALPAQMPMDEHTPDTRRTSKAHEKLRMNGQCELSVAKHLPDLGGDQSLRGGVERE